jgi:cobalt-zinc-cadmium efflux system outer membrane protein
MIHLLLAAALGVGDLERMALEANPSVRQAEAAVAAARGREKQAGLYPNPVLGMTGDEIAGGAVIRGGELGGFFEQRIVTAGKLGSSRGVAAQERAAAEQLSAAQKQRIRNAARMLFYQALGDQRRVAVRTELKRLADEAVQIAGEMVNTGLGDQPDKLSAEIEAQRAELALVQARNAQVRTWRQIGALMNQTLAITALDGDLETLPRLDASVVLERIYAESPELRLTEIEAARAELAVARARKEPVPDIVVRGGVRYNRELLEANMRPVGREGFFDIGVEIPLFNRNQGNIAAARAEASRAKLDIDRTKLALRARLAAVNREYQDAVAAAASYKNEMIPRAEKAYAMYRANHRAMSAAYPMALNAQRNLAALRDGYVDALVEAWVKAVEMEGYLLAP